MNSDYQTDSKDINDKLFECSFLLISLLLKQYKENAIDKITFINHSQKKIMYLLNNFDKVKDGTKKTTIKCIMNECLEINSNAN